MSITRPDYCVDPERCRVIDRQNQLPDYPELYRQHHVLLCTSGREGGPIPVIEALMCGLPILSTDVGYVPEIIAAYRCGEIISITDSDAKIREVLLRCLDLSVNAEQIRQQLSWAQFREKFHASLE